MPRWARAVASRGSAYLVAFRLQCSRTTAIRSRWSPVPGYREIAQVPPGTWRDDGERLMIASSVSLTLQLRSTLLSRPAPAAPSFGSSRAEPLRARE